MIKSLANSSITNEKKYRSMMAASVENNADHLIAETVLSSNATSVTFDVSSLAALGYKHLEIRYVAKTSRVGAGEYLIIRFNGDNTLSNYKGHEFGGNGSSVYSAPQDNTISRLGRASGGDTAYAFGCGIADIPDFASSVKNKTIRSLSGYKDTGAESVMVSVLWMSTAPITTLTISSDLGNNILVGSRFSLYASKG